MRVYLLRGRRPYVPKTEELAEALERRNAGAPALCLCHGIRPIPTTNGPACRITRRLLEEVAR